MEAKPIYNLMAMVSASNEVTWKHTEHRKSLFFLFFLVYFFACMSRESQRHDHVIAKALRMTLSIIIIIIIIEYISRLTRSLVTTESSNFCQHFLCTQYKHNNVTLVRYIA